MRLSRNVSCIVFLALAAICLAEGWLHRKSDYIITSCMGQTTLLNSLQSYPHGYCYDNDIDNNKIFPEGYELAAAAYTLAGTFEHPTHKIYLEYTPNKYRLMVSALPSLLLSYLTLKNATLLVNVIFWSLASYAMWWIGVYIFHSNKTGILAGVLCATCQTIIILFTGVKGELFQLSTYILLTAISLRLDHFANEESRTALMNSFLLGILGGICLFASFGTYYFIPFLITYGLLNMRFSIFIKRTACFLLGCLLINILIAHYIKQPPAYSVTNWIQGHGFKLTLWWTAFTGRMTNHFIFTIPAHLWIGALIGIFCLNMKQLKLILCLLSTFILSETIMVGANPYQYYTPVHYYLQIIFPIYLLNAKFLYVLLFEKGMAINRFLVAIKRLTAITFILITILVSNFWLLGNKYYFCGALSPLSTEILYHSFFSFDNLYVYDDITIKNEHQLAHSSKWQKKTVQQ